MFCKNCNIVFNDNLKFCTSCGEKLSDMELLAMVPVNERDSDNIPNMLFWKLQTLCNELNEQVLDSFDDMDDEIDMINSYFNDDMEEYERKRNQIESDANLMAKNANLTNRSLKVIEHIKNYLWVFEAANHLLLKAGHEGVDLNRLKIGNINIRELADIEDNFDKLSSIDDFNFVLNDFMSDLALYSLDVADRINEIIE